MSARDRVWLVETGEYEQRGVFLVAASLDAAVAAVKRSYGPPYRVEWGDLSRDSGEWSLAGDFAAVPGKSTKHRAMFDITPWDVETDSGSAGAGVSQP